MANGSEQPGWILKCQDLVQLYYGVRMIAAVREQALSFPPGVNSPVLPPDPRRIRYEIIVSIIGETVNASFSLGTPQAIDASQGQFYGLGPATALAPFTGYIVIERSFLADLDAVTLPVNINSNTGNINISTRETFLTPVPQDE